MNLIDAQERNEYIDGTYRKDNDPFRIDILTDDDDRKKREQKINDSKNHNSNNNDHDEDKEKIFFCHSQ